MRVISKSKLREYYKKNIQAEMPLTEWYFKMEEIRASNLLELREYFNSVDVVHNYTVFNIGGNNYRLITALHYNKQICYIRKVWTHAEYSKSNNQQKLKEGCL